MSCCRVTCRLAGEIPLAIDVRGTVMERLLQAIGRIDRGRDLGPAAGMGRCVRRGRRVAALLAGLGWSCPRPAGAVRGRLRTWAGRLEMPLPRPGRRCCSVVALPFKLAGDRDQMLAALGPWSDGCSPLASPPLPLAYVAHGVDDRPGQSGRDLRRGLAGNRPTKGNEDHEHKTKTTSRADLVLGTGPARCRQARSLAEETAADIGGCRRGPDCRASRAGGDGAGDPCRKRFAGEAN